MDVTAFLNNFDALVGPLMGLVTGFAFLAGIFFIIKALMALKNLDGSGRPGALSGFLINLSVGLALVYLRTIIDIFVTTAYKGDVSPLSYISSADNVISEQITMIVLRIIQLIGLISFIRGWILLSKSAGQNGQPVIARSIIHIFGGILAINIQGTKEIVFTTFGFN